MIVMVVTARVLPDKVEAYEGFFHSLTPRLRREPGIILYEMARIPDVPFSYKMIEVYRDEAARTSHIQSDYLKAVMPDVRGCFDGPPQVETYHTLES